MPSLFETQDYSGVPTSQLDQLIKVLQQQGQAAPNSQNTATNLSEVTPAQMAAKTAQDERLGDSQGEIRAYEPTPIADFFNSAGRNISGAATQFLRGRYEPPGVYIKPGMQGVSLYNPIKDPAPETIGGVRGQEEYKFDALRKLGVVSSFVPTPDTWGSIPGKVKAAGNMAKEALAGTKLGGVAKWLYRGAPEARWAEKAAQAEKVASTANQVSKPVSTLGRVANTTANLAAKSVKAAINHPLVVKTVGGTATSLGVGPSNEVRAEMEREKQLKDASTPKAGNDVSNVSGPNTASPTEVVSAGAGPTGVNTQGIMQEDLDSKIMKYLNDRQLITPYKPHYNVAQKIVRGAQGILNPRKAEALDQEAEMRDTQNKVAAMEALDPKTRALIQNLLPNAQLKQHAAEGNTDRRFKSETNAMYENTAKEKLQMNDERVNSRIQAILAQQAQLDNLLNGMGLGGGAAPQKPGVKLNPPKQP